MLPRSARNFPSSAPRRRRGDADLRLHGALGDRDGFGLFRGDFDEVSPERNAELNGDVHPDHPRSPARLRWHDGAEIIAAAAPNDVDGFHADWVLGSGGELGSGEDFGVHVEAAPERENLITPLNGGLRAELEPLSRELTAA